MADLATTEDYEARYGPAPAAVETLLAEASSLVREVARLTISVVEDDEVTVDVTSFDVFLPELPVTDVTAVELDGSPLEPEKYSWRPWGRIRLRRCEVALNSELTVTYDHGWDPVPEWIVGLVCSMVQRALRPAALTGAQSITTGSQSISYVTSAAGVSLWITQGEATRLLALKGPNAR